MRRPLLNMCWALALCGACGKEDNTPDANLGAVDGGTADAGSADGGPVATVEVGTGADEFSPLTNGQAVVLIQGPQGGGACEGYHVWGAVRTSGFDPENARVVFHYMDVPTRTDFAQIERFISLQPMGDKFIGYGFAPRIFNCCSILNSHFIMRVEVTDRNGLMGSDEREVVMPGRCIDAITSQSVCPKTCP